MVGRMLGRRGVCTGWGCDQGGEERGEHDYLCM